MKAILKVIENKFYLLSTEDNFTENSLIHVEGHNCEVISLKKLVDYEPNGDLILDNGLSYSREKCYECLATSRPDGWKNINFLNKAIELNDVGLVDYGKMSKKVYGYDKTNMYSCDELDFKQLGFIEGANAVLESQNEMFTRRQVAIAIAMAQLGNKGDEILSEIELHRNTWSVQIESIIFLGRDNAINITHIVF